MIGSLTLGAGQQTVLRLLEGQETRNGEMNSIHKICRKSLIGRSSGGWMVKERQNEDLELRATLFSVQITIVVCFCFVTASPTAQNAESTKFCVHKLFEEFVSFVQSHFDLTSATWHAAAAVRV